MVNQGTPTVYPAKVSSTFDLPYKKETDADVAGTCRQGSIGLWCDHSHEIKEVEVVPGSPYIFPFNNAGNTYALNITAAASRRLQVIVTRDGRGLGVLPERTAFLEVMVEETGRLSDLAGLEREAPTRRTKATQWRIWQGFCSDDPKNAALEDILIYYSKIRLGIIKHDADEYKVMVYACNHYLVSYEGGAVRPLEAWMLPVLHAIHYHMQLHYTGRLRPLLFADGMIQCHILAGAHALTSKTIT